jgi:molybdenum cofactor cytidylyltransferase
MREDETALVILASGLSQRFGRSDKLTAPFRGKPLIQHIIDSCKSINFGKRFAVVPSKPSELHDLLKDNDFILIENNRPMLGKNHSVKLAAQFIHGEGYNSIFLALGDMPFVTNYDIKNIIQGIGNNDKAICCYNDTLMPPAIFRNGAINKLMTLNSRFSTKALFGYENYYKYKIPKETALDIDTKEELQELS